MRTQQKSRQRRTTTVAYLERVNLAIDHIVSHLDQPIRLADVSRAARFSPHHFHRVFQVIVGETIADFTKRLRLDRALTLIAHSPRTRLISIASSCGFASSSDFSRAFKQRFGCAPRSFDLQAWRATHRAQLIAKLPPSPELYRISRLPPGGNADHFRVRIRDLPTRSVAYIRVSDPYKPNAVESAAKRLETWAESRSIAGGQWLGYQWENPEITPLEQCRCHVAIEAPRFTPEGEIGRFRFPPMIVAQLEVKGDIHLELRALQWLYGTWLPKSGYLPADHPAFEAWLGRPFAHGSEHFELNIQLPIKRG